MFSYFSLVFFFLKNHMIENQQTLTDSLNEFKDMYLCMFCEPQLALRGFYRGINWSVEEG